MFERKIKSTRLFSPYTDTGKPTLQTNGKGIYYILHRGKIVYIGKSHTNLKSTLYRHFQKWTDRRTILGRQYTLYERVTYYKQDMKDFKIKVLFITDSDLIDTLEAALILKHHPKDNTLKIDFYSESNKQDALYKSRAANLEYIPVDTGEDFF